MFIICISPSSVLADVKHFSMYGFYMSLILVYVDTPGPTPVKSYNLLGLHINSLVYMIVV